jgi:uncharacterized protein YaiI (UPF0178 family)
MILRFSSRLGIKSVFAANHQIPGLKVPKLDENQKPAALETAFLELCPPGEGAADRRILELAKNGDLVITRDLPLAEQLVDAGVTVLDDRGRAFTKENIREYRSLRDFTVGLADNGLDFDRTPSYGKKELSQLANSLDRELSRLSKAAVGI